MQFSPTLLPKGWGFRSVMDCSTAPNCPATASAFEWLCGEILTGILLCTLAVIWVSCMESSCWCNSRNSCMNASVSPSACKVRTASRVSTWYPAGGETSMRAYDPCSTGRGEWSDSGQMTPSRKLRNGLSALGSSETKLQS